MIMRPSRPTVICFGEALWDLLPTGAFPGGAPFNVSFHLHQLGLHAYLVSSIGQDPRGDDLLLRMRTLGLETNGIAQNAVLPTGSVHASLDAAGNASYQIASHVAWDHIVPDASSIEVAGRADAFVFGSLVLRSAVNRAALDQLLDALPPDSWRVFDVNLRAPHDDFAGVEALVRRCTLLKLNAGEASRLVGGRRVSSNEETKARCLREKFGCPVICITAGERGAGLLASDTWHWVEARPVAVSDTIGAGDAFTAGLLAGLLLHRESAASALERACRMGEFVASRAGATPIHEIGI